jgi:hypothetical protein
MSMCIAPTGKRPEARTTWLDECLIEHLFYHLPMPTRRLAPDTALEIKLAGTAARLIDAGLPWGEIVERVQTLADGRTDLLALAAGGHLGGYLGDAGATNPTSLVAAAVLVLAGADAAAVVAYADAVRKRVEAPRYGTS